MDKIKVSKGGYVTTRVTSKTKMSKNYMAIQLLEDGLSYLNYAKLGSDLGLKDPEKDYAVGIDFIMDALYELVENEERKQ